MTAVSVARECNLISQAAHVFAPSFVRGGEPPFFSENAVPLMIPSGNASIPDSRLQWTCMDDPAWELDDYSLKPLQPPRHHTVDEDEILYQDYSLVVTGDVFRWVLNHAPLETVQRVSSLLTASYDLCG